MLVDLEADLRRRFVRAYPAPHTNPRRRGLNGTDADDLMAETHEIRWRRADRIPADPMPWLYGIARNLLRNR